MNAIVLESAVDLKQYKGWRYVSSWLQTYLPLTLALVPLSFAYAIVRHKVIPIRFIIRQGLRYLLVRQGALLLIIVMVWLTVTRVLAALFNDWQPEGLTIGLISAVLGIVALQLSRSLHQRYLAPAIDRRFFRESYDAQQLLADLGELIRTITDQTKLLEFVARRIQAALQTRSVTVFLRKGKAGKLICRYHCAYDVKTRACETLMLELTMPLSGPLVQQAAQWRDVVDVENLLHLQEEAQAESTTAGGERLAAAERLMLRQLHAALLVPLLDQTTLIGLILIGERLADWSFTTEDKRLVANVGAPTSLALQNIALLDQRLADARKRQELEAQNDARARELEEARQLQLAMLPKSVPQLPGLSVAAYMKTATQVGQWH